MSSMKPREWAIIATLVVVVYAWLGLGMIYLKSPIASMLVYYLGLCFTGGLMLKRLIPGKEFRLFELRKHPHPVLLTLGLIIFTSAAIWAFKLLFQPGIVDPEIIRKGIGSIGMSRAHFWIPAGILIAINPFSEEFLWRWSLLPILLDGLKRNRAIMLSSVIFAGYHVLTVSMLFSPIWLVGVFLVTYVGGLFFANLLLKTHSLWYPIIVHMIINANLMMLGYLFSSPQ